MQIWKDYVEEVEKEEKVEDDVAVERKVDYQSVVVVEATPDLRFYAQMVDQGPRLEALMSQIRQEFQTNAPLPGSYTPKRGKVFLEHRLVLSEHLLSNKRFFTTIVVTGDLCAAKFEDGQWYRAKVEKVTNKEVHIFYIDYGNKEVTTAARCASLPSTFTTEKPFAHEFNLAFVKLPLDVSIKFIQKFFIFIFSFSKYIYFILG